MYIIICTGSLCIISKYEFLLFSQSVSQGQSLLMSADENI